MANLYTGQTPALPDNSDGTPGITTATSVAFDVGGLVNGIRFYSTTTVSGTYIGALWEITREDDGAGTGTLLASKTMGGSPAGGGWNTITFDTPVTVTVGKTYRAGLFNDAGRYVATSGFFASPLTNGDIIAPEHNSALLGGALWQGTFTINAALSYPTSSAGSASYFVDVDFSAVAVVDAAEATGTGTAFDAQVALTPVPAAAAGTGAAFDPLVAVAVTPAEAAGTGTAFWDAGSSISLDLIMDTAVEGFGTAYDAVASTASAASPTPAEAAGTGTAYGPAVSVGVNAGAAAGVGTAEWDAGSSISLDLVMDNPVTGAGQAFDAIVSTSQNVAVVALEALGTGAAYDALAALGVAAVEATGTGSAFDAVASGASGTAVAADVASGSGVAYDPAIDIQVYAGTACGVGAAYGAHPRRRRPGVCVAGTIRGPLVSAGSHWP